MPYAVQTSFWSKYIASCLKRILQVLKTNKESFLFTSRFSFSLRFSKSFSSWVKKICTSRFLFFLRFSKIPCFPLLLLVYFSNRELNHCLIFKKILRSKSSFFPNLFEYVKCLQNAFHR